MTRTRIVIPHRTKLLLHPHPITVTLRIIHRAIPAPCRQHALRGLPTAVTVGWLLLLLLLAAESAQEGGVLRGCAVVALLLLLDVSGWGLGRQFRAQTLDLLVGRSLGAGGDVWLGHQLLLAFGGHRRENVSILLLKHLYQVLNLYSILCGCLLLKLRWHSNCHIRGPTRCRE